MVLEWLNSVGLDADTPVFWFLVAAASLAFASMLMAALAIRAAGNARSESAEQFNAAVDHLMEAIRTENEGLKADGAQRAASLKQDVMGDIARTAESLRAGLSANRTSMDGRLDAVSKAQSETGEALRKEVTNVVKMFGEGLKGDVDTLSGSLKERVGLLTETLEKRQSNFEKSVGDKLGQSTERIGELTKINAESLSEMRRTIEERLEKLRADNEKKLEEMRLTVDEKLQSTLEKRIGESFKHVSERLEHVHRGLGEMQVLAGSVGDLKKVLSNVKDRGGWGEIQLGSLLDQMLAREQYVVNARIDPNSQATVEFAIRLPGGDAEGDVLLPIDAKFPKEDYERLVDAWETGDTEAAKASIAALEAVIEAEAKKIREKYIKPPYSTDFAILFLPTEGLFAEVMRRPGLSHRLQTKYKVTVAGPNTLAALLNSLQMGFRTLAIQKRSSEVWTVLGQAKEEFEKYGQVWEKLRKQLATAQNTVDEAGKRTRAVARKLRDVESIESIDLAHEVDSALLPPLLSGGDDDEDADGEDQQAAE